jgi:hypothetical protein
MPQQWPFKDFDQAIKEFARKEKLLNTGILVLINHVIYCFEDKKAWESHQSELLKTDIGQYALTNLAPWHEWLREREQKTL